MAEPFSVMWWIPDGYTPTLAEGWAKLESLRTRGPSPEVFTLTDFHESPTAQADMEDKAAGRPA